MAEARREFRPRPAVHGRPARGSRAGTDAARADSPGGSWPRGRVAFSRLTLRILAVNVLALAILVGGLMYLPEYRRGLVEARTAALAGEARIIAGALGESAVTGGTDAVAELDAEAARILLRRIAETTSSRARLFGAEGNLVADSSMLSGPGGIVRIEELPPPRSGGIIGNAIIDIFDGMAELLTREDAFERYRELAVQHATDYPEVVEALNGSEGDAVRFEEDELFMVSAALPVQRYKSVVGALLVSSADGRIEQQLRELRLDILKLFAVVMAITVLMSLYLARSIVAPLVRLSRAADQVRRAPGRQGEIPDFTGRHDEIGDLSGSVRGMTDELWRRIDAIEQFAADVAHEIKNPLSSLQSAVETAARIDDPERRERLMAIIVDDVGRLNRLITDISHASRLDSQIVRERESWEPVDLEPLLHTLVASTKTPRIPGRRWAPGIFASTPPGRESCWSRAMATASSRFSGTFWAMPCPSRRPDPTSPSPPVERTA